VDLSYYELQLLIDVLFDAVCNPEYSREKSDELSDMRRRFIDYRDSHK
jgi:hypothetical protein